MPHRGTGWEEPLGNQLGPLGTVGDLLGELLGGDWGDYWGNHWGFSRNYRGVVGERLGNH